ncbi:xanthine dehydrogenase family protein molybdopterin-binding subunit [Roseivirga pacifica]|uniref:xanthine dehydrogenase family protein molybdopterin-binding subunit n=1 Tax=Roseivirga pacifica TaxID=1267423 RepID=UPI00209544DF|nr:molybdopterin cofactor-binding domain-containing protein [Roseivirga pacifica]MCO6360433.1 molybdopterin-dependent oxidoreductase [Roseivirga pacifica]MCO6368322.1 molybdopterin-dependent oxidoreductase [Roseivirga pacifica]MCO6372464.1 molybdopterin-dependent oxidoreductase [Roseivirga pacifica]MCO6376522.1 molybdopterin-dependent oxidoreductase [Roseivirga pacifica]MCO6378198.1 molybdopterin-dependent oxidoreductase [Roseivirga pacifica]
MSGITKKVNRRSFLKSSALAGGGFMLSFSWLFAQEHNLSLPKEAKLNGFVKVAADGTITIMSPNPEGGQNVKTSMPMIVAEELDVNWEEIVVEQAPLNTDAYNRQYIGGSQAIRMGWEVLRTAGATARLMLVAAAAKSWNVPIAEITTELGVLHHKASGKFAKFGEMASMALEIPVPENVTLKSIEDFEIIGTSKKNVEGKNIVTGKPLYGIDYEQEGMLIAMITHPPKFGTKIKSVDDAEARKMPGIKDVFIVKSMMDDYERQFFDTCSFTEVAVIVGDSTWQVMQAKKALKVTYEPIESHIEHRNMFGQKQEVLIPAAPESTTRHAAKMEEMANKPGTIRRTDGNPDDAFEQAAKVIERSYTGPHLAHNCMEPMNFYAHVTADRAELAGPLQKPELTEQTLSVRLGMPVENINIQMTRLGGGYGRRSYAHWLLEAALISQKVKKPIKLIYSREDDMTSGIYRSTYHAKFRAALNADNKLIGFHVKTGGIPESPLSANRFPAGAVDNYLAEDWTVNSNLTVGSFRAPRSNFMASSEQSFLDELAEEVGQDPIDFRLALLEKAKTNPVGQRNDYDPVRYAGVLKLVKEKAKWGVSDSHLNRGVSAYFCHNTYAAIVLDMVLVNGRPKVERVYAAVDCGIVVNPDAAQNMIQGAIVDGIGTALFGEMTFTNGEPDKRNFDRYRMIRMAEAPKSIEVHFVESNTDPTGLGEPAYPPTFAAVANALYKATGKRFYKQPYLLA